MPYFHLPPHLLDRFAFDDEFIALSEPLIDEAGVPPDIGSLMEHGMELCRAAELDDAELSRLGQYLTERSSDIVGRFVVLSFLYGNVEVALNDEYADSQRAKDVFREFISRLDISNVKTPRHAIWELRQSLGYVDTAKVIALCGRYAELEGRSADDLNLMIGRCLWLKQGRFGSIKLDAIDGPGNGVLLAGLVLPDAHCVSEMPDLVIDARAFLEKAVAHGASLGVHWGVLAQCAAMTGEPARAARIYETHRDEIVEPWLRLPDSPEIDFAAVPAWQLPVADLWEQSGNIEETIRVLSALRDRSPRTSGVHRRLAELYLKQQNFQQAYESLRAEAECDPAYGEDPIVSLALQAGIAFETIDKLRDSGVSQYESSPAVKAEMSSIEKTLDAFWAPFGRVSGPMRKDWIRGLHRLQQSPSLESDAARSASEAIFWCSRALESHLRETIFEPFRALVLTRTIIQLPDGPLRKFLEKGRIELGTMLSLIDAASRSPQEPHARLWELLKCRASRPNELTGDRWRPITAVRNPNSHESRADRSTHEAKAFIDLCRRFFEVLEDPPPTQPGNLAPDTSRPMPGRPQ